MGRNSQRQAFEKEGQVFTKQPTAADPTPAEDSSSPGVDAGGDSRHWHRRQSSSTPPPWRVEGLKPKDQDRSGGRSGWSRFLWLMLGLLIVNWLLSSLFIGATSSTTISYSFFSTQVRLGNVQSVTSTGDTIQGTFRHEVAYPSKVGNAERVQQFTTQRPSFASDNLFQLLEASGATINANAPSQGPPLWEELLLWFGPALVLAGLLGSLKLSGRSMGMGGLGQSRARQYDPSSAKRTTFADVAGIEEVKNEVTEIVDFLRNPDRYRQMGAQIPRGVLLSGPPGTGKTLLARAVAGEAEVPFFSISASEFVEMIVGVGASRVRDLFDKAKQVAPAIIFIDELDAIGRARGGTASVGGYDEREQTLNQILTEMDGFTGSEGVVVLAATNRPEVLDAALLRPGRFDRRVTVSPPDQRGRAQILRVHTRGVPLDPGVDLDAIASSTPGMVGADLKNLVNEAALLAVRRGHEQVMMADFTDSLEKLVLGTVRGIVLSARGTGADGVPRIRSCPAWHADSRCRPGAQDIDHPEGPGPRCHLPGTGERPVRLFGRVPPRPDHRCAGWARSGRGRLRRCDHGCGERPRARQQHRPTDGGSLGNVTSHRARLGAVPRPVRSRRSALTASPRPPKTWSMPRRGGSSRSVTSRQSHRLRSSRDRLDRLAQTFSTAKRWTRTRLMPPLA